MIIVLIKELNLTTLRDEVKGAGINAVNNAVNNLKKIGLITEKMGFYPTREFSLTEKGKEVELTRHLSYTFIIVFFVVGVITV